MSWLTGQSDGDCGDMDDVFIVLVRQLDATSLPKPKEEPQPEKE